MAVSVSASMLKILKSFLLGQKREDITPSEAEKIQKVSYALNNAEIKKQYTPTYMTILSGLNSTEKQVFEASVYYLTKIAAKKNKYREDILKHMREKMHEKDLNPEFKEYLKHNIQRISIKNNQ